MNGIQVEKAKLAVVFPVYNGEATLEKSLRCIADQDFADFQAFIVENRSTDRSLEIAERFCAQDPRFHLIKCPDHRDALGNLLRSMEIGRDRGEFFCLRACDDLSTSDYLSKLIGALEADPSKLLAVGSTDRISPTETIHLRPSVDTINFHENLKRGRVAKSLFFPSEWFYGIYRSDGGAQIVIDRWKSYGSAWCTASFSVAEFVMRGLVVWVDGPKYYFFEGSGSADKYMVTSLKDKVAWRWRYASGCYAVTRKFSDLSILTRIKIFRMCWRDAGRKTRYRIRRHIRDKVLKRR